MSILNSAPALGFMAGITNHESTELGDTTMPGYPINLRVAKAIFEAQLVTAAMQQFHGNVSHTARAMGITRRVLQTKLKRYGINARLMRTGSANRAAGSNDLSLRMPAIDSFRLVAPAENKLPGKTQRPVIASPINSIQLATSESTI